MEEATIVVSNHLDRVEEVLIQEEMQRDKDYANSINVVKKERRAEELVTNSMYGIINYYLLKQMWGG